VAVPDGGESCCCQPVGGGVGVVPEHAGAEVGLGAGPALSVGDGQQIAVWAWASWTAEKSTPMTRSRPVAA
jgi:hypothetical protein